MLKVIISGRRTGHLTRVEFYHHLLNSHASLVESSPALKPLLRYVQNHVRHEEDGHRFQEFLRGQDSRDSVIELWWENSSTLNSALSDPRYLATIRPDEEYFTEQKGLLVLLAEESEIFCRPRLQSHLKCFDFLQVCEGIDPQLLLDALHGTAQLLDREDGLVRRRVINKVVAEEGATFAQAAEFTAVTETWISDVNGFPEVHRRELQDLSELLDLDRSFTVYAVEFPILDRTQYRT